MIEKDFYILYGAGELGKLASQFFDFYDINYSIAEDNPSNKDWNKIDICDIDSYDELIKETTTVLVCISTVSYNMIRDKLIEKGFKNIKPFFQVAEEINKANGYKHPLTNGWQKTSWKESEENNCDKVARSFNDSISIDHYYSFIHWHTYYTEFVYCKGFNCNDRYFIPEVTSVLHDHEVFVDAGAYDGRVTKKFIEIVKGKYNQIMCIEPDENNFNLLSNNIDTLYRVSRWKTALGNKNRIILFAKGFNYLSKVDKKSDNQVMIHTLDNWLKAVPIEPTFIKYHLEGYELEAIKGSIKTIKKYRPIVAVTTYHTEEGLYKLPMYLIKNLKDYNFYWRNHNYQGQGAVMYCIPKERNKW
jgi:FkbM family methyltransferase